MGDAANDALDRDVGGWAGDFDEEEEIDWVTIRQLPKTCRYCHKEGLYWGKHEGKWRLFDGKSVHTCAEWRSNMIKRYK